MFSSASVSESRELLDKLEQFRATVLAICSLPQFHDSRTTIVLFATGRQFDACRARIPPPNAANSSWATCPRGLNSGRRETSGGRWRSMTSAGGCRRPEAPPTGSGNHRRVIPRPRPHEVLAAMALQGGERSRALDQWRRAAESGSDNPYVYLQLAADGLDHMVIGLSLDYRLPGDQAAAPRRWLDRAVALSPRDLEAYERLAMVEAFAEWPRFDVVNRVQAVVPKMRDKTRAWFAIALLRWRMGDDAAAGQIAKTLLATPQLSARLHFLTQRLNWRLTSAKRLEPPLPPRRWDRRPRGDPAAAFALGPSGLTGAAGGSRSQWWPRPMAMMPRHLLKTAVEQRRQS